MFARKRAFFILGLLCLSSVLAVLLALRAGSVGAGWGDVIAALGGHVDTTLTAVVRELRLPRAMAAFASGGLLALAGALMQVLLRNPLADPYVLGVSGGAAVGALSAIFLGWASWLVDASAFAGAFGAMVLVFGLARGDGSWTQSRLLLTGVIVAAGCGAVVVFMLVMTTDTRVQSMLFWLTGDVSGAARPWPALFVLVAGLVAILPFARDLNVLARGELGAQALGVGTRGLRVWVYVLASVLTAAAVTLVGLVGFVGLIVPHLVRLAIGNDQRLLLPAAVLAGGTLLTVADTAARTLVAPTQLPVGVLTALIGVPVFLFLLIRHPR
ncbi:iron ABC transporter permease [Nitrogeniibacter mangrovi]|uniref:Iron ABC transporter permease n=1 Tax=Nitrogeniibacter mangrovi TaxID=2016596 RepID=A0A6C1AZX2_9RHOO|nr:iron ABC transporter permease [Nitrogeniibacter mangrovi]QID16673.1 iron ABC transporter permease [Nitrogeniibacter mangrovi]